MKLTYIVDHECLVKEYMNYLNLSRRFSKKVKLYGKIYINGVESKNYFPLKNGDELVLEFNEEEKKYFKLLIEIVSMFIKENL